MTILHRPEPPERQLDMTDQIYARAIELGFGPSRRKPMSEKAATIIYWTFLILAGGWIASMAFDRDPPLRFGAREVVNPDRLVAPGQQLQVRSTRKRLRSCELTRRWSVVDGQGRRFDYEPERFDAYGPVTPEGSDGDTEINGPFVPLDANPGRGRWISTLAWDCNMLQRALGWSIVVVQPAIEFEITKRSP